MVTLRCCIGTSGGKQREVRTWIPFAKDWDKSMQAVLSKAPKAFKFLQMMDAEEWAISISGTVIDHNDTEQFKQALCAMPPESMVVEIVKPVTPKKVHIPID